MDLVAKLAAIGYDWAPPPNQHPSQPLLNAKRTGRQVCVSGQVPLHDGQIIAGKVGADVEVAEARRAAEICAFNSLCAAGSVVGPDDILGVVDMKVFVNCAPGFSGTSTVANGASEFMIELFGERGKHTRAAIGVSELPLNAAVEITVIFEVR